MLTHIKRSLPYVRFREWNKALRRRMKLSSYLGNEYRCPVCEVRLRAFKPVWKSYGKEVEKYGWVHSGAAMETFNLAAYSCPACDASDRERLTALYLDGIFRSFDQKRFHRLLEFGPAHALHKKLHSYPFIAYRSADLYRPDVEDRVDLTDMASYADDLVDIFLCSHVLEHIPDDGKAMRELYRILKPGGLGIVLVPLVVGVDEDPRGSQDRHHRAALEAFRDGRSRPPIRQAGFHQPAGDGRVSSRPARHRLFRRGSFPARPASPTIPCSTSCARLPTPRRG